MDNDEQRQQSTWRIITSPEYVRLVLSTLVVGGFVATVLVRLLLIATRGISADILRDVASVYSGIIGTVIGYYFGRNGR